jgi:hypothetical protein
MRRFMTSVLRFVPVPAERPRAILDVHRRIAGLPVTHRRPPVARLMGSALRSASRNRLTEPADLRVLPRSFTKRLVGDAAMPNTNRPLPIQCPKCQHNGSTLLVKSLTILTLTCASCAIRGRRRSNGSPLRSKREFTRSSRTATIFIELDRTHRPRS